METYLRCTVLPQVVKCSICGDRAVASLPYARLVLCRKHFTEFIEKKVEKTIKRYKLVGKGWRVLVAVSGGKDSSTLLTILAKLAEVLDLSLLAIYINLGIPEYSEKCLSTVRKLVELLNVKLIIVDVKEAVGYTIPELAAKLRRPACSVCGTVKRYILNAAAIESRASALALGHNLDDLAAYALKEFLNQNLGQVSKFGPKTESISDLAVGRIRPLYEVLERESLIYALVNNIPFLPDECPYVRLSSLEFTLKNQLNKLESRFPSIKVSFIRRLAKNLGKYPRIQQELTKCTTCGLIASTELCSFCRMTKRVLGRPQGSIVREYIRNKLKELK